MFTTKFTNEDRKKFVNWFAKLNTQEKGFIMDAFETYLKEHKINIVLNRYIKWEYIAHQIFKVWQEKSIREMLVTADFNEIILIPYPFTYSKGTNEYWQRLKRTEQLENE